MRTEICFTFVMIGCTASAPDQQLPSATYTPHLDSQASSVACGDDVAFYGNTSPDLRYLFTYDAAGRLSHAAGAWANNGPTDSIDYQWSGNNLTHMLSVSGWDSSSYEITAHYDASASLLDYTWAYNDGTYDDAWTYAYSNFAGPNQPLRLQITEQGQPDVWGYNFVYDTSNRLVQAVPDSGPTTTWAYDDDAHTITSDTGNGAWTDELTYDEQFRIVSAEWGGSDPAAIAGDQVYAWSGDQLSAVTYRSGSQQAPQQLDVVQVDTLRYDCSAARTLAGRTSRFMTHGRR